METSLKGQHQRARVCRSSYRRGNPGAASSGDGQPGRVLSKKFEILLKRRRPADSAPLLRFAFLRLVYFSRIRQVRANPPDAPAVILIRNATILTVIAWKPSKHGLNPYLRNGKIAEVGASINAPKRTAQVDRRPRGQFVMPGINRLPFAHRAAEKRQRRRQGVSVSSDGEYGGGSSNPDEHRTSIAI